VRLLVALRDDNAVPVDLGVDARIRPVEARLLGPVLSRDELAADKLLALFGRANSAISSTSPCSRQRSDQRRDVPWPRPPSRGLQGPDIGI
jgi:hypothetical protein